MDHIFYELREALDVLIEKRLNGGPCVIKQITALEKALDEMKPSSIEGGFGPLFCMKCAGFYNPPTASWKFHTKANFFDCEEHFGYPFYGTRISKRVITL